jgi:dTDP-4-dehydrorhamnose reductase
VKLLVTGRNGQLVRSLLERGSRHPDLEILAVGRPEVDLERPGSLSEATATLRPDVVINAAAYTGVDSAEDEPERAFRVNAEAAGEAAAAAAKIGAPIVQLSTDYVFNGASNTPYAEDAAVEPLGVYGRSKLEGEKQVREVTPDHVVIRTARVYSPFGHNFVRSMLAAAGNRPELTVVADQQGCPTSALDLADALLLLVKQWRSGTRTGFGETFHVAGSGSTTWYGFACEIMAQAQPLGLPTVPVRPIRTAEWPTRAPRPSFSVLDSSKFARATEFVMPRWQDALADVLRRLADPE